MGKFMQMASEKTDRRPFVNLMLVMIVFMYVLIGAWVFDRMEREAQQEQLSHVVRDKKLCLNALAVRLERGPPTVNHTNVLHRAFMECFENDYRTEWQFTQAAAFAFSIVTVLGFGNVSVMTNWGKIFYLIYASIGIPLVMVVLTNLAKYIVEWGMKANCCNVIVNFVKKNKKKRRRSTSSSLDDIEAASAVDIDQENADNKSVKESVQPIEETENELHLEYNWQWFALVFAIYLALGAAVSSAATDNSDYLHAVYANFRALTADFKEIGPHNITLLALSLFYVCIGLMIMTTAFDLIANNLRKLHYMGATLRNVRAVKIWFGSRRMSVNTLVRSFGQAASVSEEIMDGIDLDELVECALQGGDCRDLFINQNNENSQSNDQSINGNQSNDDNSPTDDRQSKAVRRTLSTRSSEQVDEIIPSEESETSSSDEFTFEKQNYPVAQIPHELPADEERSTNALEDDHPTQHLGHLDDVIKTWRMPTTVQHSITDLVESASPALTATPLTSSPPSPSAGPIKIEIQPVVTEGGGENIRRRSKTDSLHLSPVSAKPKRKSGKSRKQEQSEIMRRLAAGRPAHKRRTSIDAHGESSTNTTLDVAPQRSTSVREVTKDDGQMDLNI